MNEIEVKIDYLSATFPLEDDATNSTLFVVHDTVEAIAKYFNCEAHEVFKEKYAHNNFNYEYRLGEFIILRLDGPMNENYRKTCQLELKGDGCRDFEKRCPNTGWLNLFLFITMLNGKIKRIDIAIDDFKGDAITMEYIFDKVINKHQYTSTFRSEPIPIGTKTSGMTIQFGSHSSPTQLVIYDKKIERSKRNKTCNKDYWVRYEIRFRAPYAERVCLALLKDSKDEINLKQVAFEQLYRTLDIKEDNNYADVSQCNVSTDSKWEAFLNNVEKVELPKVEDFKPNTMEKYMKAATPYISTWLIYLFLIAKKDPNLFEMDIYKFLIEGSNVPARRMYKLNIYLKQMGQEPLDAEGFSDLMNQFKEIYEDKLLPF